MDLPYSVLRHKKTKNVRIIEATEEVVDSKNIKIDFDNQLKDITSKNLYIEPIDIKFIIDNINLFYRNNLAVLLLAMNIRRYGDQFINSQYYESYFSYIARKDIKDEDERRAFSSKLSFEISCYSEKIQNIINSQSNDT